MVSLLLAIIYLAFISLGLPDSLLGSAWPVMRAELWLPVSYAGIMTVDNLRRNYCVKPSFPTG